MLSMEKNTPHCKLSIVKALVEADKARATATAFQGARELGINTLAAMCEVIRSLKTENFYKSMTTHANHKI